MVPRVAIPLPHSIDHEYAQRAIPQYERAVALAGAESLRIPLGLSQTDLTKLASSCDAVLLPGSNADLDPSKFRQARSSRTAGADALREETDFRLLEDAFAHRKPVLCICYGLQSLNVFRGGSLVQHIPDFLSEENRLKVNHEAGKKVAVAHTVEITRDSLLANIIRPEAESPGSEAPGNIVVPVNSSHHQSAEVAGDGLRIVARCPDDGIIEALEGTSPEQFLLAVQWHPERSVDDNEPSRAIFRALIQAAR
jgi:putative glutamine amidotransferase